MGVNIGRDLSVSGCMTPAISAKLIVHGACDSVQSLGGNRVAFMASNRSHIGLYARLSGLPDSAIYCKLGYFLKK